MNDLINRIGALPFIQIVLECWNELFIIVLMLIVTIEFEHDKAKKLVLESEKSIARELVIFFITVLIYNVCDILNVVNEGLTSNLSRIILNVGIFTYYAVGGFQTLFFLQVFRTHLSRKIKSSSFEKGITAFQILQIPLFVILIATPFTGFLYVIDESNRYVRSWGYMVWQAVTMLSFAFLGYIVVKYINLISTFFRKIIAAVVIMPIVGIVCSLYIDLSFTNIMASLSSIMIFMICERNKTEVTIKNALELERTKTLLAESRLSLEQSKNQTLMAQIQPHFINNSLMALCARCVEYPEIYESITNFSMYLRSHFEALGDTKTITFEQEMMNIEAYIALEQQNYKDRLVVEYEIECDDFLIPALSVQPLVENAIRHGIGTYDKGGTVRINSYRKDKDIVIEVIDDGSGKNNITVQQKKRKGVGVENVRARLRSISNGELEIINTGNGTIARVTLRESEEDI